VSESDHTTLRIRGSTESAFEEARQAVALELDGEPTPDAVVRELCEAYCGRDALGAWRNGNGDSHD